MSEFTDNQNQRISRLMDLSELILKTGNARGFILENKDFIASVVPYDFIFLFDELVSQGHKMEDLKSLSNKILNIFHTTISGFQSLKPEPGSFLDIFEQNNREMEKVLKSIRPVYKSFIKNPDSSSIRKKLLQHFERLEKYTDYYVIKENVLFPVIEKNLPEHRCLQIMWSFHDDIRKSIKSILEQLSKHIDDKNVFNRCVGDAFFNMLAIKFREENILFPYILSSVDKDELEMMNQQALELGFPYIQPEHKQLSAVKPGFNETLLDLGTGALEPEQIKLIFNHLPVDITYVDEHDKVQYFSEPKERIFPRTKAIVGRDVHNCHPPESIHVVEKIIQSFRKGEKDNASFWINIKGKYILIQYFAVRNETNAYKGVIEVSQEISEIKMIEGEKRLLDW
jgi:PAS domain S-box-containing protein